MSEKEEKLEDYYQEYDLDRTKTTKDIRKELMKRLGDTRTKMAGSSLNGREIQLRLEKETEELLDAIKIFKNDEKREEYDEKLSVQRGKVAEEALVTIDDMEQAYQGTGLKNRIERVSALKRDIQENKIQKNTKEIQEGR